MQLYFSLFYHTKLLNDDEIFKLPHSELEPPFQKSTRKEWSYNDVMILPCYTINNISGMLPSKIIIVVVESLQLLHESFQWATTQELK